MAALSFSYAPPVSGQYTQYLKDDENIILNKLQDTCQNIMTSRSCQISVAATNHSNNFINISHTGSSTSNHVEFNVTLTGTTEAIMSARGDLLQKCPLEISMSFQIQPTSKLPELTDHFQKLEKEYNTNIIVTPEKLDVSSLILDNAVNIEIVGTPIQVEQCRVRVLVVLDEVLNSFKTEVVRLPLKLQYLICGRKRAGLLPIIEETATNIYFPSPFTNTVQHPSTNETDADQKKTEVGDEDDNQDETQPPIYITGEPSHVSRVKDMLNKLAVQKAKSMYHKDTAIYARKLDWLLLHRRDELRKIMHDNGAYIEFPPIGSGESRVTVFAENRVNAERTLRALNFQACNIYEACFYFNNRDGAVYDPATGAHTFFDSTTNLSSLVCQLSQVSGSEVIYKTDPGFIEVLGAERAIRNVYQRLQEMQFLQVFHQYTIFRVESSNEQRDFISGKKNGKINKIMKTSGAKIRFMPYMNDYNFMIEVESTSFTKALDGLTLLQEELPAEISFYVPESYHKRIIGVGGKNIQRIMKKYGVYVKFSNTEEFASLGGYYNNEDNVVARTPMKNQINLDNLRHAVMELIHPKDRDYVIETVQIPFRLHRDLIHEYQNSFINEELVKKTNTNVLWPDAELASNDAELLGPEAHMPLAFKMLESIIPESYLLHLPYSKSFTDIIQTDLFQDSIVQKLLQDYDVRIEAGTTTDDKAAYVRLDTTRDKILTTLRESLQIVIDFLKEQKVEMYEDTSADSLFSVVEKKLSISAKKSSRLNTVAAAASAFFDTTASTPTSVFLKSHPQSILGNPAAAASTLSMMRSVNDSLYTSPPNHAYNPQFTYPNQTPPPSYQFFNFPNQDTATTTTNATTLNPLDKSGWASLNPASATAHHHQQPMPSTSTSIQQTMGSSNVGGAGTSDKAKNNNIRAIFDAPMDLSDQERVVLSNYRYQRMGMPPPPPPANFGFLQPAVPGAAPSAADIWSTTPSQISATAGAAAAAAARRSNTASSAASSNNNTNSTADFNPYNDTITSPSSTGSLKNSQSMPEPILEAHFQQYHPHASHHHHPHSSTGRTHTFATSPTHGSLHTSLSQLYLNAAAVQAGTTTYGDTQQSANTSSSSHNNPTTTGFTPRNTTSNTSNIYNTYTPSTSNTHNTTNDDNNTNTNTANTATTTSTSTTTPTASSSTTTPL